MPLPPSERQGPLPPCVPHTSLANDAALSIRCGGGPMSRPASRRLVSPSTRSAGALGRACATAMTSRVCLGPIPHSHVASALRGGACCGPRARRAKRRVCYHAKGPGNSSPDHRQRPTYWGPCIHPPPTTWHRQGSALLRIANGSACRAAHANTPKRHSINCGRGGQHSSLQAQGDFCGIADYGT